MKRFRKLLSAVLALTMILSTLIIIPATVHAETETGAAVVPAGTTYSLTTDLTSATQGQFRFVYGTDRTKHIYFSELQEEYVNVPVPAEGNVLNTTDGTNVFYVDETTGKIRANVVASDNGDIDPAIVFVAPETGNYYINVIHSVPSSTGGAPYIGYHAMGNDNGVENWGNATDMTQTNIVNLQKGQTVGIYARGWATCVYEVSEFTVEYRGYTLADDPAAGTKYSVFSADGVNTTDFTYGQVNRTATDFVNGVQAIDTEVTGDAYWGGATGITGLGIAETTTPLVYVNEGTYGLQANAQKKTVIYFEAPTCGEYVLNFLINVLEPTTTSPTYDAQQLWQRSTPTVYIEGEDGTYTTWLSYNMAGAGNSYLSGDTVAKRTIKLEKGQSIAIAVSSYDNLTYTVSDISLTLNNLIHVVNNWTADDEGHWQTCTTCGEDVVTKTAHTSATSCTICGWGADYVANVSTSSPATVTAGTDIPVKVTVGGDKGVFHAAQLEFTYDSALLEVKTTPAGYEVENVDGKLTLTVYGTEVNTEAEIEVVFTAKTVVDPAEATVTLSFAGFSDKVRAETLNVKEAAVGTASVTVTIANEYDVTLPEFFTGNEKAYQGEDYTFTKADTNYDYTDVKVNGEAVPNDNVTYDEETGTWTIAGDAITGDIAVTATVTGKYFNVGLGEGSEQLGTGEGAGAIGENAAQYKTDYVFYLPANIPATTEVGYNYTLGSLKIGENAADANTAYKVEDRKVTVYGAAIKGDIEIVVTKTTVNPTAYNVTFEGVDVATGESSANIGEDYTFTITPDERFTYTVTYTVGGVDMGELVAGENNTYTIPKANVTDAIVIDIVATVPNDNVEISKYLTLNGADMYLVVNNVDQIEDSEGRTYFLNGNKMFWSERYNAYCYLVIVEGNDTSSDSITVTLTIQQGANAVLNYNAMDVNKSGKVDVNDAQLVWNMYSTYYSNITESVTVEKLLLADVAGADGDDSYKIVDTSDSAAIVAYVFANN